MTDDYDRASAEGLLDRVSDAFDWRHGDYDALAGLLDELRAALRSSESDSGIGVERLAAVMEDHAWDIDCGGHCAAQIVREYARLSTPRTETSGS